MWTTFVICLQHLRLTYLSRSTATPISILPIVAILFLITIHANAATPNLLCEIVVEDNVLLQGSSCDTPVEVCLTAPLSDMTNFVIMDNGVPYSGSLSACQEDTVLIYNYADLEGGGNNGPYHVDDWTVDAATFSGSVVDMLALVDSMNNWDPSGNWVLDIGSSSIRGGNTTSTYGSMTISHEVLKSTTILDFTTSIVPSDNGTSLILEPGFHSIEITDTVQACSDVVTVVISCTDCPNTYTGAKNFDLEECMDSAALCTDILIDDLSNFELWLNGVQLNNAMLKGCNPQTSFAYDYSMLTGQGTAGPYVLQNWTVNGSSFLGFFNDIGQIADSMNVWDPTADWQLDGTNLRITGGNQSTTYSAISIQAQSNPDVETLLLSTFEYDMNVMLSLDTGYHELIIVNNSEACQDTNYIQVSCSNCPDILGPAMTLDGGDCDTDGIAEFCVNIPTDDLIFYQITDNGQAFTGNMNGCNPDTSLFFSLENVPNKDNPGLFSLDNWTINGNAFSAGSLTSFIQMVDSMNVWDTDASWTLIGNFIRGGDPANNYGSLLLGNFGPNAPEVVSLEMEFDPQSNALELTVGLHDLVVMNTSSGCVDSVSLNVNCTDNCPDLVPSYAQQLSMPDCNTASAWCIAVSPAQLAAYTIEIGGVSYEDNITACEFNARSIFYDISVLAQVGRDPFELTNWVVNGQIYSGSFLEINVLVDSMNVWHPAGNWTFDVASGIISSNNVSASVSTLSISQGSSNFNIQLEEETEATASSLELYTGNHQIVISNSGTGCRDSFQVLVDCISKEWITDTVAVNATDTICLSTEELLGNLVSIENICATSSGEFAVFELERDLYCLAVTGVEAGTDSACIQICDDLGLCDTTYFTIHTIEATLMPIIADDTLNTIENVAVREIDVTANDTGLSEIDTLYLVSTPTNGMAVVNSDYTITYTPNDAYCNGTTPDQFEYVACNKFGCDTGQVSITVFCDDVKAFTGFSPNGDNKNDRFYIEGIETLTNSQLTIFNRWGNQVYRRTNYQNGDDSWDGTFDGVNVPDGTYFYLLEDDSGRIYSGYVQLNR